MNEYMFVCKHNVVRSRFGARFFSRYLKNRGIIKKVDSAGVGFSSNFLGKRITEKLLKKIDKVFVMEKYMKDYIIRKFKFNSKKIIVLNILDDYGFLKSKSIKNLNKIFKKINWKKYL